MRLFSPMIPKNPLYTYTRPYWSRVFALLIFSGFKTSDFPQVPYDCSQGVAHVVQLMWFRGPWVHQGGRQSWTRGTLSGTLGATWALVNGIITPESLQEAKFRIYFFIQDLFFNDFNMVLIWFEDMNLIRFEFGVMNLIWFCYVFMVWVVV